MKNQLNNQKGQLIKGKVTKSANTFRKNKPNSSEDQFSAKNFSTGIYERFHPLPKQKNKPNQTQYKAKANPIYGMAKFTLSSFMTSKYVKSEDLAGKKQTQYKANFILDVSSLAFLSGDKPNSRKGKIDAKCVYTK